MPYFIDTHDKSNGTFPESIDAIGLRGFVEAYVQACEPEGVTILTLHVCLEEGRAWCLTSAPDALAVQRAHARVGLPYDGITEVKTVTPGDLYL